MTPTMSLTSAMTVEMSSISDTVVPVACWIPAILLRISSVARAVCWASSLISLATTANPRPASPALAASMVALRASRFVCEEMAVMVAVTLPMASAASPRS